MNNNTQDYIQKLNTHPELLEKNTHQWLLKRLKARWFPRDLQIASHYIKQKVGTEPFFLYGAGTHSQAILQTFQDTPLCHQLKGILDGNAKPGQQLQGYSVFPALDALKYSDHKIVLSHHEFEDSMYDHLIKMGVDNANIIPIYLSEAYGEQVIQQRLPEFSLPPAKSNTIKRVVTISARPTKVLHENIMKHVRQEDQFELIQIKMDRLESETSNQAYHHTFCAQNSIFFCFYLLQQLNPDLVIVQEHYPTGNFLPMVIKQTFPHFKVVGEFYDFLPLTFNDPYVLSRESYWRPEDVKLALTAEAWCLHHLDGMITKESGEVLGQYLKPIPYLEFRPHLTKHIFKNKTTRIHSPIRLIYAGRITPSHEPAVMFGDNQLIDVFQALLTQHFSVTTYSTCTTNAMLQSRYADYLELAKHTDFHLNLAIPQETLLTHLANNYDFGLILGIPKDNSEQQISYQVTVSGKLCTYMAAGIPVIVGSYLSVMAKWVSNYGIGIVVDAHQLESLPRLIQQHHYPELVENVIQYREKYNLENALPDISHFLKQMLASSD